MSAAEEIDNDDVAVEVEDTQESHQEEAKDPGFISKEDWVANGRDAKDWRDPVEYRHQGELIKQRNEMQRRYDDQIKNLNLLHEVRLQNEREELIRRRDEAIDVADRPEVKRLDAQIANNDRQVQLVQNQPENTKHQEVVEWEEENPWSQDANDPRLILANKVCSAQLAAGKTLAAALRAVDKEIAAKFTIPSKSNAQMVEGSRTASGKKEGATLSWGDLTSAEEKAYSAFPQGWKTKTDFLKAAFNARKGTK